MSEGKIRGTVVVNSVFVPCFKCGRALEFDLLSRSGPDPNTTYVCPECWQLPRPRDRG